MMSVRHKSFLYTLLLIGLWAAPAAATPGTRGLDARIDDKFAVAEAGSDTSGERASAQAATRHIRNARMYYWLGIEEAGNLRAFRQSQTYLDKAAEALAKATVADTRREELGEEIDALRATVAHQRTLAEGTFYGSFPLVRLLVPTLFVTSGSASNYHLIEDPRLMAVRELAQSIRDDVMSDWTTVPNMHVVFRGASLPPVFKSEFLRAFNESARFYVHSDEEVARTLPDSTLAAFRTDGPSSSAIQTLRSAFGSPLAVVSLTRPNRVGDAHMYQSTATVYGESATTPSHSIAQSTTVRDRRGQALPLLFCNLLLLALAVGAYLWTARSRNEEFSLSLVVYPTLAFLIARFLFAVVYPVIEPLAPAPETPVLVSLWWPLLAGFALFIGLPAFVWFTTDRYGLRPDGYGGPLLLAAALGAVAYVATPLFLWSKGLAWGLLAVTAVAAAAGAYLAGSALDEVHWLPRASALLPAAGALLLGGVLLHAHETVLLLTCAALTVSYAGLFWYGEDAASAQESLPSERKAGAEDAGTTGDVPTTRQELLDALQAPAYVPFSSFDEADRLLGRDSSPLVLTGPSGVGKTATAEKLLASRQPDATVLSGSCSKPLGEPTPFEPFREALEAHFELEAYTRDNVQAQHEQIASMLDGVFESFVPFVSMLSPPLESSTSGADSRHEVFRAVTLALRQIATRRPVYLFIDDLQWADGDSIDLLRHLLEGFPPDSDGPVHFLFACRTDKSEDLSDVLHEAKWDGTGLKDHVVELSPPTKEQQIEILTSSLGLEPEAAEQIVRRVDTEGPGSRGQLFWLFEVVRHLSQSGILRAPDDRSPNGTPEVSPSTEGFALSDSIDTGNFPVPTQFQVVIGEELEEHPRYRRPLAYAACLGQTFRASTLTEILGQSRFEILSLLRDIEQDTGWIRDVQSKDDVYEFSSSYLLEGMRKHFEIQEAGPTDAAPQLIREYHAQAARALETVETEIGESQRDQIANHYYAAGASHAERAYQACLSASRAMQSIYSFKQAQTFLDKARDCADVAGLDTQLEEEALRLTCYKAHIRGGVSLDEDEDGNLLQEAVDEGTAYLDRADAPSLETVKAVAQVCYDRARSARAGKYFQKARHWGEYLLEHGDSPVVRAEGHHFIGISLPPKPETRDEREEHLREALVLLNDIPEPDPETKRLRGRVMNSLANLLSDEESDSEEREEARSLYERRIGLNETHKLGDLQGLAMSHGGLGRLLLYHASEVEEARKYFEEDLQLAKEIGDVGGQVQMHSHLGECALRLSKNDEARRQYELSLEEASAWTSVCFALVGLLITCTRQEDTGGVTTYGRQLAETIQWDSLFEGLEDRIQEALESTAPVAEDRDWFQQIRERLDAE